MTDHHPFLVAILSQLGSVNPVLIYADWLEEQGDDAAAWWRGLAEGMQQLRLTHAAMTMYFGKAAVSREAWKALPKGCPVRMGKHGEPFAVRAENAAEVVGFVQKKHGYRHGPRHCSVSIYITAAEIRLPEYAQIDLVDLFPGATLQEPSGTGQIGTLNVREGVTVGMQASVDLVNRLDGQPPFFYHPIQDARPAAHLPLSRLAEGVRRRLEERGVTPQEIERYLGPESNPSENIRRLRGHAERIGLMGQVVPISTTQMTIFEEAERIDRPPTPQERESMQFWWDAHPDTRAP